jgi:glycosyltransferase involved in cell wall biosynthesis
MKTFLIHDWLYTYVGSERVLEAILQCIPVEKIFTTVDLLSKENRFFLNDVKVIPSFIQRFPWVHALRRHYFPLMPFAMESFDVSDAELIISSSSAVAKGVITHAEQLHICYCYTPARYAWDLTNQYLIEAGLDKGLKGLMARLVFHYFRLWDVTNSNRVDHFITLSKHIARRIWHIYRRESTVIYPPVDLCKFHLCKDKDSYYLTVSRLETYKKVDLIVDAFSMLNEKLVVVGDGPELNKIKRKATANIEILGYQPDHIVKDLMEKARAFIFAANEDYGIVSLEAQASGTPVIALGRGGSLETVKGIFTGEKPQKETTGIFFREQTPQSLLEALAWFKNNQDKIDPEECRRNAESFSPQRFKQEFEEFVRSKWESFKANGGRQTISAK